MVRFRRVAAVLLGGLLIAGFLSGSPAQAASVWDGDREATSELNEVELPGPARNANRADGGVSALSRAVEEAQETEEPVPVEALTTPTEEFVANPDGTVTRDIAQSAVRVEEGDDWVEVDPTLEASDGRLEPKATAGDVSFSGDGEGVLADLSMGERSVSLSLAEVDLQAPKVDGPVATYEVPEQPAPRASAAEPEPQASGEAAPETSEEPDPEAAESAVPQESVQVAVKNEGFAAHVILEQAPTQAPTYVFDLATDGLVPSLQDGVLSLADADGEVVAQSLPLRMWDAQVDEAGDPTNVAEVDAELERAGQGWRLTLSPSMEYLGAESTQYPVTVDPDIASVPERGDVQFRSGADANRNFAGEPQIEVGRRDGMVNRGFFSFEFNQYLGATVTDAELRLYQYYAPDCTARSVNLHSMTGGDRLNATWNTQPAHTTVEQFTATQSFNRGAPGCARNPETIDVTQVVNGWAGQHVGTHAVPTEEVVNHRQAFIARAGNEGSTAFYKRFCSQDWSSNLLYCNSADVVPRLSVTFEPEIGEQSWYSMTERQLDERTTVKVNNKNANLFVQSQDLSVKGIGTDLSIDRMYNSQSLDVGPMGRGWSLNVGPDVWLEKKSEFRYDFHTPGGTILGSFVRLSDDPDDDDYREFSAPLGGVGAELTDTDEGFVLAFRSSQMKYAFNETNADGDAFMTAMRDRSDNRISIDYEGTAGSKPRIASITDTVDRVITPTYSGAVITQWATADVAGVGVRDWNYTYDGQYLASATNALDETTDYAYTSGSSGSRLLSSITAPANDSGARPTTEMSYATAAGQVATVGYRHGNAPGDVFTYSWDLNLGRVAACDGNGDVSTVVTDPRANDTTYCYDARNNTASDAKTWVYDALGNARSQDYNSDNQPLNGTNATGQGVAGGSTVAAYNENISDQLSSVTAPRSDGAGQGESSAMTYDDDSELPGGAYLPLSVKDGAGDCNRYGYDDAGRTTTTFSGITANASGECGSATGAREFHRDFNDNGTLKATWDANSGDEPTDADKTVYTYWQDGDAGFVAGSAGQVKTIRKPGGDCSTGSRRLCTSYAYDGAARVTSMTDGRGIVTRYAYDANDRTTVVYFNNTTGAQCGGGGITSTDCISYTYDAAGNLIQRLEDSGQSAFSYDRLNRQTVQITPTGLLGLGQDRLEYVYDAAGNMIGYSQAFNSTNPDVTTYAFDEANRPTSVTSAVGTFDLDVDEDGRTTGITYPNPNNAVGLDLSFGYTRAGKPTELDWRIAGNIRVSTWEYDYTKDGDDVSQLQSRTMDVNGASTQDGTSEYTYEEQRLTGVENSSSAGADYAYSYDDVGNVLSEATGGSTTHFGYNKAGERCWQGATEGNAGQKLSRECATGPSGSTEFTHDAAGNNTGATADPVEYNERSQVDEIAGIAQDYLDQGNDLRRDRGSERHLSGSMGISASTSPAGTVYYTRDPSGNILAGRIGNISWFYISEPNGHVAALTDVNGGYLGGYEYSPYGKTQVIGATDFNPIRWLGSWQEGGTTTGDDQVYKFGARYYTTSGAFTQPDALPGNLGDPRTMTAYNYAGADPINQQDASGNLFDGFSFGFWDSAVDVTKGLGRVTLAGDIAGIAINVGRRDLQGAIASGAGLLAGFGAGALCSPLATTGVGVAACFGAATFAGAAASEAVERA